DLEIGAYGSDDADREKLVPIALRRAAERHGIDPRPEDVWVVGDTPRDLACARAGGARCLLVGTGNFGVDELRRMEPDAALADLSDTEAAFELLAS
ncbi:MAG TPA: HAD hydrolase-like protein, partial [Acidimicrobiales bacterium]|nr:HAD hydrolase-like protein [Acidimicrobiales bacterium]